MRFSILKRLLWTCLAVQLIFAVHAPSALASVQLTRHPYIQYPTTSSIVIVWETDIPALCTVEYGLDSELTLKTAAREPVQHHIAELTDLSANSTYYYRILVDDMPLTDVLSFYTAKDAAHSDFSFVVFGDCGTGDQNQINVANQMYRVKPDFGLITGDVVYPRGAAEDYEKKYFLPYKDIISSACFFPALGNHDYRTANGQPYFDNFILPANNPEKTERYYSFDYGEAHFICVDSNPRPGSVTERRQLRWLEDDLSSNHSRWTFVFLHHPPYSSGYHGSTMNVRRKYSPLFEKYSVDIVFCGHDHTYERTVGIKNFVPDGEGVIYVVTGGGGGRLYDVGHNEWTAFAKKVFHFLHVKIRGKRLELRAIDGNGNEFDQLILEKDSVGSTQSMP
jgi:3',5'-cyclic AMP phosphodiesterase CpdA